MSDWSGDLGAALAGGNAAEMKATLERVPKEVLQRAIPFLDVMGKTAVTDGKLDEALTYYSQLIELEPAKLDWRERRAQVYFKLDQLPDAMADADRIIELSPEAALGHRLKAEAHDGLRERPQAVDAYKRVLQIQPDDAKAKQRIQFLENELRKEALLKQAIDPSAAGEQLKIELPPPPDVSFDPALFDDPSIPDSLPKQMVDGLRQHLLRYSGHQSPKNSLRRLEDPTWTRAWDEALQTAKDKTFVFHGSELGVFALRAREHGATRVFAAEAHPMDQRIAGGIAQKHLLTAWHALHGEDIQAWTEDERRTSFEEFANEMHIDALDSKDIDWSSADCFAFPNIDHTLLGTGIVKAIRRAHSLGLRADAALFPAQAKLFAMPIQWNYAGSAFDLRPMNDFRWSFYPQALELASEHWTALAEPIAIGTLDFQQFSETHWQAQFAINRQGRVDAIAFWFELDLGSTQLGNAPGSTLQAIKPAYQYADGIAVEPGQQLPIDIDVRETRLHFKTQPPAAQSRAHQLPSWYVPMLLDRPRNEAFDRALRTALAQDASITVLDIGAGCGLLSMQAARAGAQHVYSCEVSPAIAKIGQDIVDTNSLKDKITLINKDCRKLTSPDDLPQRADLAVFELFDCSLIGEGVLHFVAYAREHLLKDNARLLPLRGKIRAAVIEYRLNRILDVDVNLLNPYRFSPAFINVDASKLDHRVLTEPFDVFEFDFATATPTPEEKDLAIPVIADGTAGAVLFWFELQLDESTWLSNDPQSQQPLHWKQGLQFLPEANVDATLQLPIVAKHDGSGLNFLWKQDGLPKERFSALPRFDPRWWQQAQELEHQTRGLLQHCMQNPDEYAKVADLAKRFAIDPAAYDLDPIIAQRFAASFFGA